MDTTNSNVATPPTPAPAANPTVSMLEQLVLQQQQQIQALMQQNQQRQDQQQQQNPDPKEFYENPHQAIRREVAAAIAPMGQFVQQLQKQQQIQQVSSYVSKLPMYATVFPHVQLQFEQALMQAPEVNFQTAQFILNSLVGQLAVTNPGVFAPVQQAPQNPGNVPPRNIPAHLQPSAPAANRQPAPQNPGVILTELDRRMMREWGMTEEQYIQYRDAKPWEVTSIGG